MTLGEDFLAMLVCVDDVLITSSRPSLVQQLKDFLNAAFTIKDLGHAKFFLGLKKFRDSGGTKLCQHKYILDILSDT